MKKSKRRQNWKGLFWIVIGAIVVGLFVAPTRHMRHAPTLHVAVVSPSLPPSAEPIPLPGPPSLPPGSSIVDVPKDVKSGDLAMPAGDEKSQTNAVSPESALPPHVSAIVNGQHPRIALVIDDVGLDLKGSRRAIKLPAFVTLSYMPYAVQLKEQTHEAEGEGHELLLHMPMEPVGRDDPGPGALLVDLSADKIRERLETALASFTGFDGVNNHMGSKFTADTDGMEVVIAELSERHLFFLDSRTSAKSVGEKIAREHNLPTISRDVFLDDDISPKAVRAQLEETERLARRRGFAVAIGHPHAITLQTIEEWLPEAQARGVTFVPLHALIGDDVK